MYPIRITRMLKKGAAVRCRVQLLEWRWHIGAIAGYCRMSLQGVVGFFSEAAGGVVLPVMNNYNKKNQNWEI